MRHRERALTPQHSKPALVTRCIAQVPFIREPDLTEKDDNSPSGDVTTERCSSFPSDQLRQTVSAPS